MKALALENYGWTTADGPQSCSYVTPVILATLKRLEVNRVLDLGSGNGALCKQLHARGYEVAGVERDHEGIKMARANCGGISFYNYAVEDDPHELLQSEAKFDAVVSTEVIEHLFSPHLLLAYAREVLKPSGYLVLTTPYHGYLKNLALSILDKWDTHHTPLWHGGHIKFWSRSTLSQLLVQNGFSVVSFSGVGRVPYLWKSMVIIATRL